MLLSSLHFERSVIYLPSGVLQKAHFREAKREVETVYKRKNPGTKRLRSEEDLEIVEAIDEQQTTPRGGKVAKVLQFPTPTCTSLLGPSTAGTSVNIHPIELIKDSRPSVLTEPIEMGNKLNRLTPNYKRALESNLSPDHNHDFTSTLH